MSPKGAVIDASLLEERAAWRRAGARLVLTNGCFDLLHAGHLELLFGARASGDILVVAINSDSSVRRLKGPGRPLIPAAERAELLLALEPVDRVVIFEEETPLAVVSALLPDVLVKGADWGPGSIVGSDVVAAHGGQIVRIALVPGRSTSAILERVRRS